MLGELFPVRGDCRSKFSQRPYFRGHSANNRWPPAIALRRELQHRFQLCLQAFQHHGDADLFNTKISAISTRPSYFARRRPFRERRDHVPCREAHNVHLHNAHGFYEHELFSGSIEDQRESPIAPRQAPEESTHSHRPDKNFRVAGVALHPYAVAENGTTRVRTRRIHRNNSNAIPLHPNGQPDDRRACSSRPGAPGHSYHEGSPYPEKSVARDFPPSGS